MAVGMTPGEAVGALRRGVPIQQVVASGSWVGIEAVGEIFEIRLYAESTPDGVVLAESADAVEALVSAERLGGASRTGWSAVEV
ncbi:MAG: hypothetical protein HOV77_02005 [Hamadaea sp.]|uniref:hypothetical protein n=1 Tax=Hamadaea sp. TaxID=2024425 RepID=UPI0017AB1D01|nr:hypothetical protein [Hamadaea sp.]NUT17937.1 hypothetical protein [Hamadaea sp.]